MLNCIVVHRAKHLFFIGLVITMMQSCIKDPRNNYEQPKLGQGKVFVVCEGNYMWNNARLDVYTPDSQKVYSNVYETVNHKPIGDVLQSGFLDVDNRLWLVVNNSGKIIGLNANSLEQEVEFTGLKSPRYVCPMDSLLIVTDLYANEVKLLNSKTGAVEKSIQVHPNPSKPTDGWTESVVVTTLGNAGQFRAIAAVKGEVILLDQAHKIQRIAVDSGANFLANDYEGNLWVQSVTADSAFFNVISTDNQNNPILVKRIAFSAKKGCARLGRSLNGTDMIFIYNNQVRKIDYRATNFSESTVVFTGGQNLYGLKADFIHGLIFVADALDYVSEGKVYVLDGMFNVVNSFKTGVNPSNFIY